IPTLRAALPSSTTHREGPSPPMLGINVTSSRFRKGVLLGKLVVSSLANLALMLLATPAQAALSGDPELADDGHIDFIFCNQGGNWQTGAIWHSNNNPFDPGPAQGPVRPASSLVLV